MAIYSVFYSILAHSVTGLRADERPMRAKIERGLTSTAASALRVASLSKTDLRSVDPVRGIRGVHYLRPRPPDKTTTTTTTTITTTKTTECQGIKLWEASKSFEANEGEFVSG